MYEYKSISHKFSKTRENEEIIKNKDVSVHSLILTNTTVPTQFMV